MGTCQYTGAADVALMSKDGSGAVVHGSGSDILFPNSSSLKSTQKMRKRESMRGSSSAHEDDYTESIVEVAGTIAIEMGRHELDRWLPRVLGATEAANTFNVAESLKEFSCLQEVGDTRRQFDGCFVNQCTISGESGGPLVFSFDLLGKTVTEVPGSTFINALEAAARPTSVQARTVDFCEGSLVFDGGGDLPIKSFNCVINNKLTANYYASKNAQCIDRDGEREVTCTLELAHDAASEALVGQGGSGATAVLSFVSADNMEFSIILNGLKWEDSTPTADGKGKLNLSINAMAHAIGDADTSAKQEIYITNNSTAS